jgi:hypothetical protein
MACRALGLAAGIAPGRRFNFILRGLSRLQSGNDLQSPIPLSGSAQLDRIFPQVSLFLIESSRRISMLWNELAGEGSLFGGELLYPLPGGLRQPLHRQN